MKILHYSLGFPPYRAGGLTKYVTDLMENQVTKGHIVTLLWPGRIRLIDRKIKIKKNRSYLNIDSYEIINPLPVPLLDGIDNEKLYTFTANIEVYEKFLEENNPDIIHVHTLMGIHKEFFLAAQKKGIKIIYTSHDYFGLCCKTSLLFKGKRCNNNLNCNNCVNNALSLKKIYILQSKLYRNYKDNFLIRKIRSKNKRVKQNSEEYKEKIIINNCNYEKLYKFYSEIFGLIDMYHFNSNNAKNIYSNFIELSEENYKVLSLTHKNITDNRAKIQFCDDVLRISYLGSTDSSKGFRLLTDIIEDLVSSNYKLELNVYGGERALEHNNINYHGKYEYKDLKNIFMKTDLLVVPSLNDTFGFVTLEGLSFGVPIIVTDEVGSKDLLINNKTGFVVNTSYTALKEKISECYKNREILRRINRNILENNDLVFDLNIHEKHIFEIYEQIRSKK